MIEQRTAARRRRRPRRLRRSGVVYRNRDALFLPENLVRGRLLLDALRDVAQTHDATPSQVALAWVIRKPNVVVIPGAISVEQLADGCRTLGSHR